MAEGTNSEYIFCTVHHKGIRLTERFDVSKFRERAIISSGLNIEVKTKNTLYIHLIPVSSLCGVRFTSTNEDLGVLFELIA